MKAKQFKLIRKALKLTHATLALALDISPRSISYYENGRPIPEIVALAMRGLQANKEASK